MEENDGGHSIDPKSGFCFKTKVFHSIRSPVPLPPLDMPLSVAAYAFSLRCSTHGPSDTGAIRNGVSERHSEDTAFIDSTTGMRLSFADFMFQVETLASSLQTLVGLSKGDIAFVLAPPSLQVPVLYFSLLYMGVAISPGNPISSQLEIAQQIKLCKPSVFFATTSTVSKFPKLTQQFILIDSTEFEDMSLRRVCSFQKVDINQSDTAAILFSSGTTGRSKATMLTHRNFITMVAAKFAKREERNTPIVLLFTVPLFHVFGFLFLVQAVALSQVAVLMKRFNFRAMLKAIEDFKVTDMPISPSVLLEMVKSKLIDEFDLSSLDVLNPGGAPLRPELGELFLARFPHVRISQGYGLTETAGVVSVSKSPEEWRRFESVGRIGPNLQAKIIDPMTGQSLLPGQQGELCLRGPSIMKGYLGDEEATIFAFDSDGWLKTGDLCYFDHEGLLFIVDRLKELIKFKAYQIPPAELEFLLISHPEISDAAVVPYPNEEAGQIPMAFVVRKEGSSISKPQIVNFIAK